MFPEVFLSEALSSVELRAYSQLAECSILLTIWGRIAPDSNRTVPDVCARYDWVDSLLTRRLANLQAHATPCTTPASRPPDSMETFLYMIAHSVTVVLCNEVEAMPPSHEQSQALLWRFRERGLWAAQEISRLAQEHQQAGGLIFKSHPFMPLAIYLSTARLAKHLDTYRKENGGVGGSDGDVQAAVSGEEESVQTSWQMAHQSLKKLVSVNRLAGHYMQLL